MTIEAQAVRILQNPKTRELWYSTFNGDVFKIKDVNGGDPIAEKILSLKLQL